MRIPLLGVILKGVFDAAGHKIENLGEPTNPHDAVTKKYVDENGGGGSVKLDDEVSETSANGVKSSGIWSFVTGLFNTLATVATSGSYNDLADKPKLPTVIELDENTKRLYVMKDGVRTTEEISSWATLFNLTKRGLVRLYYLASGSGDTGRKALYTAHMVDDKTGSTPAILFDATGFIGTNTVWTRTITLTKESTDSIHVEVGKLTEVAKKSDIPDVSEFVVDTFVGTVARTGKESEIKNAAIISEVTLPISIFAGIKKLHAFRLRCANSSSGNWDRTVYFEVFAKKSDGRLTMIAPTSTNTMTVGEYSRFSLVSPIDIPDGSVAIVMICSGVTRIALATTVEDYSIRGSTGSTITGYKPIIDLSAEMTIADALQLLADRSLDPRGGVAANVNLTAPDGTRWALGVNNDGTLYTAIPDVSATSDESDVEIE